MDRSKTLNGITGATGVAGGAQGRQDGAGAATGSSAPETPPQGRYRRSNGTMIDMASMNPHHRAAAARKADLAGDKDLARTLRASGTIPE